MVNGVILIKPRYDDEKIFITYGTNNHFKKWKIKVEKD